MIDIFKKLSGLRQGKEALTGPVEYIVVGLGNPDRELSNTRHNIGFMAVDYIAKQLDAKLKNLKFKSVCAQVVFARKKVLLLKPQTYMNCSGIAVKQAMDFYKIPPERVIIIFDDTSLDVGKLRIKRKGSHGGHNGIKHIIYLAGEDTFPRIKVGIGKKPDPRWDLKDWVLSSFKPGEEETLSKTMEKVFKASELMVSGRIEEAMNKYN